MSRVTAPWAALLALLFVAISIRVIRERRRAKVAIGAGGDAALERAIRSQANFAEYVPIALILMLTAEHAGSSRWLLHAAGAALLVGRLVHAYGLVREDVDLRLRPVGMGLTFTAIIALAITNLVSFLR